MSALGAWAADNLQLIVIVAGIAASLRGFGILRRNFSKKAAYAHLALMVLAVVVLSFFVPSV